MKIYMAILLALFTTYVFSGTIDPKNKDQNYINYGNQHECVVKLHCKNNTHGYGSAVLIKPNIILTAAHMVFDVESAYVLHDGKKIDIDIIICSKEFIDDYKNNKMSSGDIALGRLTQPIKIEHYPELYKDSDEVNKICSICGFGVSGTYDKGATFSDNNKRAGSNIIDGIMNDMLTCSLINGKKTSLEFLICHGDSGGGLFIDQKLAGINSLISTDHKDKKLNSDIHDISCHTRISKYIDWINAGIEFLEK